MFRVLKSEQIISDMPKSIVNVGFCMKKNLFTVHIPSINRPSPNYQAKQHDIASLHFTTTHQNTNTSKQCPYILLYKKRVKIPWNPPSMQANNTTPELNPEGRPPPPYPNHQPSILSPSANSRRRCALPKEIKKEKKTLLF